MRVGFSLGLSPNCPYCSELPAPGERTGRLFVSSPCESIELALTCWLRLRHVSVQRTAIGLLSFLVDPELISEFCTVAPSLLDIASAHEVRLTLRPASESELSHRDILGMEPIARFIGRMEGEWLIRYLQSGSVENVFHPMVNPVTCKIEAYECLMRAVLPDGRIANPAEMISTARNAEVMMQLDRVARLSAIRNAARNSISETIFINFNPNTRCEPEICLRNMVEEAATCGIDPARIVFEVTESEYITDSEHLRKVLSFYRSNGFRIALDDLGSGYSSLNLLTELRPDFVKLDMALIRGIDQDRYKQHVTRSLLEMSLKLGVGTVVEGVETDGEWVWATEHGAHLIQGFYFAKPAFVPPLGPDLETWSRDASPVRRTA